MSVWPRFSRSACASVIVPLGSDWTEPARNPGRRIETLGSHLPECARGATAIDRDSAGDMDPIAPACLPEYLRVVACIGEWRVRRRSGPTVVDEGSRRVNIMKRSSRRCGQRVSSGLLPPSTACPTVGATVEDLASAMLPG